VAGSGPLPLDGVQFDVEPWVLTSWNVHRSADARDWVRFVQSAVTAWTGDGLTGRLGFTVPYWFDGTSGGVPKITVDGSTGYPFELALGLLSPLRRTALNVMAYRNVTSGPNGSVSLFAGNLATAADADSRTALLVGRETGEGTAPQTTFYGMTCASFETATDQIADAFDGDALYQGIAVEDVESLENNPVVDYRRATPLTPSGSPDDVGADRSRGARVRKQ
jgi:hypothetical protein